MADWNPQANALFLQAREVTAGPDRDVSRGVEYSADFPRPERLENTPDTIALFDFTIDTGRYAIDRSGHGHHGIIMGAKFVKPPK